MSAPVNIFTKNWGNFWVSLVFLVDAKSREVRHYDRGHTDTRLCSCGETCSL